MINTLLQKADAFIEKNHMLDTGDHVITGVSGGADSMCLLFVLKKLAPKYQLTLTAVHINHGLRGEAADADEAYVADICRAWEIPCLCFRKDIHELARREKMTEEEAGRAFRYACFERVMNENGGSKIAVAHHMNDLAETVLFNMFRGSYLKGMGGMAPVRDRIIRPLLCLERTEIEMMLDAAHIAFRTDHTNFDTTYTRNKIRLELLPYICGHVNTKAVAHIAETAFAAREAYDFIHTMAAAAYETLADDNGCLDIEKMLAQAEILQKEILRLWFEEKTGKLKDVTREHVESMLKLLNNSDGKCVSLPYGMTAVRRKHKLCLERADAARTQSRCARAASQELAVDICIPGHIYLKNPEIEVTFELTEKKENQRIPQNDCTKWFDYDKIYDGLKLRHRKQGDFMTIAPACAKKALRRVMIDDKIPKDRREQVWLLADGAHILWMLGSRISEYYKVTDDTKKILIVKIKGEKVCQTKSAYY